MKGSTRFRDGQLPSCLDLLFTNEEAMVDEDSIEINPPLGKSDHSIVSCNLKLYVAELGEEPVRRQYFKGDYEGMKTELGLLDWDCLFY